MELYRIHAATQNGGSSWGGWSYFEDNTDSLQAFLLEASIEVASERLRGSKLRIFRAWDKLIRRINGRNDDMFPRIKAIHQVQKLVDGEWVDVTVEFIPPAVVFT